MIFAVDTTTRDNVYSYIFTITTKRQGYMTFVQFYVQCNATVENGIIVSEHADSFIKRDTQVSQSHAQDCALLWARVR